MNATAGPLRIFLIVLLLATAAGAQPSDNFQISVDVSLVVLQATVSGRNGHFAPDLAEQNFTLYEDGVRQTIKLFRHEDVPVTVGLVVDHSGSMQPKLAEVVAAARSFVESSNERDQMFVVNFNDRVSTAMTHGSPFLSLSEHLDLENAILGIPALGMTRLYDALRDAQDQVRAGTADKKALIVISDGGDNASKHTVAEVLNKAESSPALIYTIGIFDNDDPDRNPDVLRRLARFTGGEAFFPAHLEDTVAICRQIAHDIRNQYTLGYVSTNTTKNGAFRNVRVEAVAPGQGKLLVRTRSGYIAVSP
jgi:VWFA-related protein